MGDLKPGWRRVKLGDVAENINDYFDRDGGDEARYVAGEHIDEGTLTVRRWGLTTDSMFPPTYNRKFRAGDVLYHSRNLNKLVCPDFDGVTGEKLFILRVNEDGRHEKLPSVVDTRKKTVSAQLDHFSKYAMASN